MRFNEAIQQLKFKREKKFALVGEEPYLKSHFIKASKAFNKEIEFLEFWPDSENDTVNALSDSLFSERLVIIHHVDEMKLDRLTSAIKGSDHTVIAVFSDEANTKTRGASTLLGVCSAVQCVPMKEYGAEYPTWMESKISNAGYIADNGVVQEIYSRIGPDLSTLSNELNKLFLLKEETKHLEMNDVNQAISVTATRTAYDILEGLMRQDVSLALASFQSYSGSRDTYVEIIAFLFAYVEKMYRMILLRDRKHSVEAIADILGLPKFLVSSKYLPKALKFGKGFLIKQMGALCDLDLKVRSFKGNKGVLVENFMYGFAPKV